ncbi:hypothetical protein ACCO45_000904 [Purpureocillium lilacinum]|uniref:Uncharacterized protein n=1 Tax=Purpureocillium lilacinum TaxID=33203 RepID=A0ACC4E5G9_PURLI
MGGGKEGGGETVKEGVEASGWHRVPSRPRSRSRGPQSRFQPWQRSITVDVPDTAPDAALVTWRGRSRPMAVTCAAPRRDPMAQGPDTHESRPGRPRMDLQEGGHLMCPHRDSPGPKRCCGSRARHRVFLVRAPPRTTSSPLKAALAGRCRIRSSSSTSRTRLAGERARGCEDKATPDAAGLGTFGLARLEAEHQGEQRAQGYPARAVSIEVPSRLAPQPAHAGGQPLGSYLDAGREREAPDHWCPEAQLSPCVPVMA